VAPQDFLNYFKNIVLKYFMLIFLFFLENIIFNVNKKIKPNKNNKIY